MRLRIIVQDGATSELVVSAPIARLGRDPACELAVDPNMFPQVSAQHARIERNASGLTLIHVSRTNKTLLNDEPIEKSAPLKVGDKIRLGFAGPTIEIADARQTPPPSSTMNEGGATLAAGREELAMLRGSLATERFEIGSGGILGRERGKVDYLLEHPLVSRHHARLRVDGDEVSLSDLGSANGTHVNGTKIASRVKLARGDRIDIGPFALRFEGTALVSRSRANNIELVGRKLNRVVQDRATRQPLKLLDDISLVIRPREFVCLLGPSGSGKSTLLAMLSGRNPPSAGAVLVNGEDLYENFGALKQDIAVVPQKEALHDSLAADKALHFTAELRLPPDTSRDEIATSVTDLLEVVGLAHRRGTLIRHLSGGQVKRASLANELMARPSLLFLDEVTSGLDEQTDREMMELFRQVADNGKTVICITHSLANVEATCHLVVILTEGGCLAFTGTPDEAKKYFDITRLGDVYRKLGTRTPTEWQAAFQASPFHARYVRERLSAQTDEEVKGDKKDNSGNRIVASPFRQTGILTRRYAAIWRGDPAALLAMLGQSLLVALLLGTIFGPLKDVENVGERAQRTVNLIFLLNVSCFWFGCNNAAKELVKERIIFARERAFNLRIDSYFASKFLLLVIIALVQVGVLFGVVRFWCGPPGLAIAQWTGFGALAVAGTALGLLLSALAKTEEVAAALVPIAVLPQIILAGVIAPLSGVGKLIAQGVITAYWGERALEALLPERDLAIVHHEQGVYGVQLAVVAGHMVLFVLVAGVALWLQGRSQNK